MEDNQSEPRPDGAEQLKKPTEAEQEQVESILRKMMLHSKRGESGVASKFLEEALELAPGSPDVIMAQAEDFLHRRQKSKAKDVLKRGLELWPNHVQLETLYGELIFDSVPRDLSGDFSSFEMAQQAKMAGWLSFFVPGLGQLVMGKPSQGLIIFLLVIGGWTLAALMPNGLSGLAAIMGLSKASASQFNGMVLLPVFVAVCAHVYSITDATAKAKSLNRVKIDRPAPPVDKDFEL